jgi:Fur family peroxide stress response transcriptional regulator
MPDVKQLRSALEKGGWRFTRQRAAVYDYLSAVESHPTAEEVYRAVRQDLPKISLATVYKALEALVDCHLANKLAAGDGPARFDSHCDGHYHLRCVKTGRVQDLPTPFDPDLLQKIDPNLLEQLQAMGFQVTGYRLEVTGHFGQE